MPHQPKALRYLPLPRVWIGAVVILLIFLVILNMIFMHSNNTSSEPVMHPSSYVQLVPTVVVVNFHTVVKPLTVASTHSPTVDQHPVPIVESTHTQPQNFPDNERKALKDLYISTHGEKWWVKGYQPYDYSWDFRYLLVNPCADDRPWFGLSCEVFSDDHDHIVSIILHGSTVNLEGTIPDTIGQFTLLRRLDLGFHHAALTGTIPNSMGQLRTLTTILLSRNDLIGTIPSSLGDLPELTELLVEDNRLSGPIPANICNICRHKKFWLVLESNDFDCYPLCLKSCDLWWTDTAICLHSLSVVIDEPSVDVVSQQPRVISTYLTRPTDDVDDNTDALLSKLTH